MRDSYMCDIRKAKKKYKIIDFDAIAGKDGKVHVTVRRLLHWHKLSACKRFREYDQLAFQASIEGKCKKMSTALLAAKQHQGACMAAYRSWQRKQTR